MARGMNFPLAINYGHPYDVNGEKRHAFCGAAPSE